jgi:lysozyme
VVVNPKKELRVFLNEIKNAASRTPIIYDSQTQFPGLVSSSGDTAPRWVRGIVLDPRVFYGNDWIFWQYSHMGRLDGIDSFVDLDVFHGNEDRFKGLLNE